MEMQIDFGGFDETIKAMEALLGLVGTQVYGDGMLAAAKVVAAEAKTLVPVKTGALRDSIKTRKRSAYVQTSKGLRKTAGVAAQTVAGGPGARHAFLVEHGTVRAAAHPYLEPAVRGSISRIFAAAAEAMKRSFSKLAVQITSGKATKRTLRLAAEDT